VGRPRQQRAVPGANRRDDAGRLAHTEAYSVWPEAVERFAAEGISPEQAVDEATARIKKILAK